MTHFRLDGSRETGEVTLWMGADETACGYKPILAWPSIDGVREFAQMLLGIDRSHAEEAPGPFSPTKASLPGGQALPAKKKTEEIDT